MAGLSESRKTTTANELEKERKTRLKLNTLLPTIRLLVRDRGREKKKYKNHKNE
jgi:hypothetical protein